MTTEDLTTIRVDQFYPHAPAKVWRALTTPDLMAQWLMPNDFQAVIGHRFTFTAAPIEATNFSGTIACEVMEVRPLELLRITWRDADGSNPLDSTVTFHLRPEGHGTRLIVEQSGFNPDDPGQQMARRIMNGGWRSHILQRLGAVLDQPSD
ncbi:MAG: SRPBCC domain-containing protein [Acidimicrobiia bacterium]